MLKKCSSLGWVIRLSLVLTPPTVMGFVWVVHHKHLSGTVEVSRAAAAVRSAPTPADRTELPTTPIPSSARESLLLHQASLVSIPAITATTDPDPVASFRQLITKPPVASPAPVTSRPVAPDPDIISFSELPVTSRQPSPAAVKPDPRALRAFLDRGVVAYASAAADGDQARGVAMIQAVALMGYFQGRNLLARNYSKSEAIRSVVPPNDAIRYAVGLVMDATATVEDAPDVLLGLAQYFGGRGQMDVFATQLLNSLRGDTRPQLNNRIDVLLGILVRVRGACDAVGRLLTTDASPLRECSSALAERLRTYIENTPSAGEEEERQRGQLLFSQISR
jgi:hypothetical protein